jgi:UDP-glucose 4-epimerase
MHNVSDIRKEIEIIINDVRNFEPLCTAVLDQDIIFNCAAYTSHPNAMKEPFVDVDVNCKGTLNLLEAMRRFSHDAKLVHIGTSTQIGPMKYAPIDENHPETPVDIYSANKSASEKYVLVYSHAYSMHATVVRLANVYGPRSNIKSSDFGFMNYFIGLGLKGKEISVFGEGNQQRTISFVADCVDALIMAANSSKVDREVFFAVSDKQYTVREVAQNIAEVIGGSVKFVEWPKNREVIEVGDAVISNKKIAETLQWKHKTELVDGLAITRDYFKPNLKHYLDKAI